MEWVETTGRTVEEALDLALDQLGVDQDDVEYEVVEEPRTGLFGRLRTEARVRARVRPTTPRPKEDRRGRAKRSGSRNGNGQASSGSGAAEATTSLGAPDRPERPAERAAAPDPDPADDRAPAPRSARGGQRGTDVTDIDQTDVPIAEQGDIAVGFVRGVLERMGSHDATVEASPIDDDTVEIRVEGGTDLKFLIGGTKGLTLQSLQELTRTVVQRRTGARSGRILVDVSGFVRRRREALARFAQSVAEDVRQSGAPVVLEPMSPAERKVIHDTINGIEGVGTSSEGEEPRRRVVISPSSD